MFDATEPTTEILKEQAILRSGKASGLSLCKYKHVSCIRCCLPHIGGDSHIEDSEETRAALFKGGEGASQRKSSDRYLGPGKLVMKFRNFNPLKDPRIEASQYEDSFQDVGKTEMERRFTERRSLFLGIYDREQPRQSLPSFMKAAQKNEGYRYSHPASSGPVSAYLGGSVPAKHRLKGDLPECQLLGFVDGKGTVGCMAHPLAESSGGYDGRDQVGFFHHSGCCDSVGCEASKEFPFLHPSALKFFDMAIEGMSWYEYSRHAISVLVYYLRAYDHALQMLDEKELLESLTLQQLALFTNALYDEWPLKNRNFRLGHDRSNDSDCMNSLEILSTNIPLSERILYIALDTGFSENKFDRQLQHARDHVERHIAALQRE